MILILQSGSDMFDAIQTTVMLDDNLKTLLALHIQTDLEKQNSSPQADPNNIE
jgi:hypothetical protein